MESIAETRGSMPVEPSIEQVYDSYPITYREPLLKIRQMIYDIAARLPEVGAIEESLKWGQPSYATVSPKSGSPIRLGRFEEDRIALFVHCQTSLVNSFRTLFAGILEFSDKRAIVLNPQKEMPYDELAVCIEIALTYHLNKR